MKNSIFWKIANALRVTAVFAFISVWIFMAFSSALVDSPESDVIAHQEQTVSNKEVQKGFALSSLLVDEKEETEEKNHTNDQKKLDNSKVFLPTIVLLFVRENNGVKKSNSIEHERHSCFKIPLYIAFHSWKTFC